VYHIRAKQIQFVIQSDELIHECVFHFAAHQLFLFSYYTPSLARQVAPGAAWDQVCNQPPGTLQSLSSGEVVLKWTTRTTIASLPPQSPYGVYFLRHYKRFPSPVLSCQLLPILIEKGHKMGHSKFLLRSAGHLTTDWASFAYRLIRVDLRPRILNEVLNNDPHQHFLELPFFDGCCLA
jgi:hypothetical protein